MAIHEGNPIGRYKTHGTTWIVEGQWRALHNGSAPLVGRQWVLMQIKSGTACAFQFVNRNTDGTFTTPTDNANDHVIFPANAVEVFPVGDSIAVYGRSVSKAGSTATGGKIAFVEFR